MAEQENLDVSMEDIFDFDNAALPEEYARQYNLLAGYPDGGMQQAFHSSRQPEGGTRNDENVSAFQHHVQESAGDQPGVDSRHHALISEGNGTTVPAAQDSRGMNPVISHVGARPNRPVFALLDGFPILTWPLSPPIHGQPHQVYQWRPEQIPNLPLSPYGSSRTGHRLPQLQIQRYVANRNMIAGFHRALWKLQPPGSIYCAAELEGTSITVHDLASQLTSLLPSRYVAVQNVPFSPSSYMEVRQYVHPVDFNRRSLLDGFMGSNQDSVFFACTVVELGDYRSVAMGRIEKGSRYPLFRPREGFLYFQIRDLAVLPGRSPGVGGWVIASLLFAVVQFVPRGAMFEVVMVVPEALKSWCERLPGMHRDESHPDYPIFNVRGRKL